MPFQDAFSLLEQDPLFSQTQVNTAQLAVPDEMFNGWQQTLDLLSEIVDTPAILIMRITDKDISVFTSSQHPENPYKRHDTESLGHGLYCETVIKRQAELVVPNALEDKEWDSNPDIKLGMIAYCGLPLTWPNGQPFGTLCMLDNKERDYGRTFRHLLARFQNAINANLASLYQSAKLFHLNQILETKVQERTLALTKLNKKLLSEKEHRAEIENSLKFQKNNDTLTGLSNRLGFINQLTQQLSEADELNTYVIYFGLRNFKSINDSYGYVIGDKVLQLFSQRIKRILDKDILFARIAGAEFVIAHRGKNPLEIPLIDSIIQTANIPFTLAEFSIKIPCCIGVAMAPADAQDAAELMQKAGAAMSISKSEGTPYSFFNKLTQTNIERRCLLESHLVDALKNQELSLHYQPLFSLQHQGVIGAEALLRWHNPLLGDVPPDQFISLAENNGQIIAISNFVLHTAIAQAAQWLCLDPSQHFRVAINISPLQFRDADFADYIANLLSLYQLPPSSLELEITEGVLLQDEHLAKHIIDRLQTLGVKISLDDFGTGYSSLSYLQKYSFDTLKIDRCFINNLEKNEQDRELTRAIIAMGKKLTLNVIAEGVETQAQDDFIRQEECDFGQGYLYGKPVDAKSFEHSYLTNKRLDD